MARQFTSLLQMTKAIPNEDAALVYFAGVRWKNGAFCPYCGSVKVYHFSDKRAHKCGDCRRRFSIKVGTVMEGTKIPVRSWLMAIWLITSHKKGIASTQLARDIGVTQKTAWFILHRLRHASQTKAFNRELSGTVEVDETFIGGKDQNKHSRKRGLKKKAVLLGMLERRGELRVLPISAVSEAGLVAEQNIARGSYLMTDDAGMYRRPGRFYKHAWVRHSRGEYARFPEAPKHQDEAWGPMIHVNGIEGYWSLLKRQIYGIHHWVSEKHLGQYTAESAWRYNRRAVPDAERMGEFIGQMDGRLTYKALIA